MTVKHTRREPERLASPRPTDHYDLVVIGLGSAGLSAVDLAAGQLGLRVAAVEGDRIGGDCLWTGCVPSKALVASARAADTIRRAERFGIAAGDPAVDLDAVWRRIHTIQSEIARTDDSPDHVRATGAELIGGTARLTGDHEVTVETATGERRLTSSFVLIATGSRAAIPPIPGIDDVDVLTSDTMFRSPPPAGRLAVVGGGPVGVEIAQAMQRLGTPVTLMEATGRLLPREEPEITTRLAELLRADGVDVRTGSTVTAVEQTGDDVTVHVGESSVVVDALLVATGRRPSVDDLGLADVGIELTTGGVVVDDRNRTTRPHVYAVGDVAAGRPPFTHTAAHDAAQAVRDMFLPGRGRPPRTIPWCTFTSPELARVGMTASEARERFGERSVRVHRRELARNDRARADGATDGVMMVVTARRRIVGAHVLAPSAGEIVNELAVAVDHGLDLADLADTVHVYPTLALDVGRLGADRRLAFAARVAPLARLSARRNARRRGRRRRHR